MQDCKPVRKSVSISSSHAYTNQPIITFYFFNNYYHNKFSARDTGLGLLLLLSISETRVGIISNFVVPTYSSSPPPPPSIS